jgi:signal transduction histidine kinase
MHRKKHSQVIKFQIKDTGIGMPEHIIDCINNPAATTISNMDGEAYQNLGFGLSTAKKIIHEVNGTMETISVPDEGTTINCIIPFNLGAVTN